MVFQFSVHMPLVQQSDPSPVPVLVVSCHSEGVRKLQACRAWSLECTRKVVSSHRRWVALVILPLFLATISYWLVQLLQRHIQHVLLGHVGGQRDSGQIPVSALHGMVILLVVP